MNSYLIIIFLLFLIIGSIRVAIDTKRQKGIFAINLNTIKNCPNCKEGTPLFRVPRNLAQVLNGGWICKKCGKEFDRWGKERKAKGKAKVPVTF